MTGRKVISQINWFQIDSFHYEPAIGQFFNPDVHWFYLINEEQETFMCFNQTQEVQVINFLKNVKLSGTKDCFINVISTECDDELCKDQDRQIQGGKSISRNRILISDFGINNISPYALGFNIIGYLI